MRSRKSLLPEIWGSGKRARLACLTRWVVPRKGRQSDEISGTRFPGTTELDGHQRTDIPAATAELGALPMPLETRERLCALIRLKLPENITTSLRPCLCQGRVARLLSHPDSQIREVQQSSHPPFTTEVSLSQPTRQSRCPTNRRA